MNVFGGGITTPALPISIRVSLPTFSVLQPANPDDVQPRTVTCFGGFGVAGAVAIWARAGPAATITLAITSVLIIVSSLTSVEF